MGKTHFWHVQIRYIQYDCQLNYVDFAKKYDKSILHLNVMCNFKQVN